MVKFSSEEDVAQLEGLGDALEAAANSTIGGRTWPIQKSTHSFQMGKKPMRKNPLPVPENSPVNLFRDILAAKNSQVVSAVRQESPEPDKSSFQTTL